MYPRHPRYGSTQQLSTLVCFYACEMWPITGARENKLKICERIVLRKIFGRIRDWHRQGSSPRNTEVMQMYAKRAIVNKINSHGSKCLGHISRMPDNRVVKQISMRK